MENLKNLFNNLLGFRTERRIIVFESDDWGSIRMPSRKIYNELIGRGIRVDKSRYDSYDSLEKRDDIGLLFDLLLSFSNERGVHPRFTFNTVLGNPDFTLIRDSGFTQYYRQNFLESYNQYYGEDNSLLWKDGIRIGVMYPQFHAREHLNTNLWMSDLKKGVSATRIAFDLGFFGLKTRTGSSLQNHYLSSCFAETEYQYREIIRILEDGLKQFETIFGFRSTSFIACNYTWPKEMESFLSGKHVKLLQGQRAQIRPIIGKGRKKVVRHFTGETNRIGQVYTVRNVIFEPFLDQERDWVSLAMRQISNAFLCRTPAIISTHRVNYVSNMNNGHRDKSLIKLRILLARILEKWPNVDFMSSDQLALLFSKTT